jgi:hypothetical protein
MIAFWVRAILLAAASEHLRNKALGSLAILCVRSL